jgi:serine/threonine-protein kinase
MGATEPTRSLDAPTAPGCQPNEAQKLSPRTTVRLDSCVVRSSGCIFDEKLDEDLIGTRLDHFEIRSLLGRGGMGSVYLAWHERLHRLCAVKVITPDLIQSDERRLEMFLTEARSAARLSHPNIVTVHSLGEDRGYYFIEMEYVAGSSLGRTVQKQGPLDPQTATRMVAQVAAGLCNAHAHGVVHSDVKPDNVMVRESTMEAKLTDFGLARIFAAETEHCGGGAVGTPPYMAPELFLGQPTSQASDIYALGASYFVLLTGAVPYPASTYVELYDKLRDEPVPNVTERVPNVPGEIAELVTAMLAKDPSNRPTGGSALVARINELLNTLTPTRELVEQAMRGLDVDWCADGDRFTFHVNVAGSRRQTVEAEVVESLDTGEWMLSFRTLCAPADPKDYEYVLRLNSRLPFGAVGTHMFEGRPYFVMIENRIRATVDPEEIRASVLHMAEWADHVEHHLTGGDRH